MRANGPRVTWQGQPYHVSTTVGPEGRPRPRRVSRQAMIAGVGAAALAGLLVGVLARPTPADQHVPPAAQPLPVEVTGAAPAAALPLAAPATAAGRLDVRPTTVAPPQAAAPQPAAPQARPEPVGTELSAPTERVEAPPPRALPPLPRPVDVEPAPPLIDPRAVPDDDGPPPDEPN